MRKLTHMLLAGTLVLACSSCGVETTANYQVIPLPQEVALSQESPFNLNAGTIIAYPENNELLKRNAEFLAEYISQSTKAAKMARRKQTAAPTSLRMGLGWLAAFFRPAEALFPEIFAFYQFAASLG